MCGIIGVLGEQDAAPLLLEALQRLEYRGYDSAGIATCHHGTLRRRRAAGKMINLATDLTRAPLHGRTGIGHTRWATHGPATLENAHPHHAGRVAVVHNGIIENSHTLRASLQDAGAVFTSQTDTETVVHLADMYLSQGLTPQQAVSATIARLEGAFALAFLFAGDDNLLIAARHGSPLVVGHGAGEMFVGSDAVALAPLTDKLTYLDDGDIAVITRRTLHIYDPDGQRVARDVTQISIATAVVDKAGYRHFMAKEIAEQPTVINRALEQYLDATQTALTLPQEIDFKNVQRVILVACGTAYYACHVAKYWFEALARVAVDIEIASEFRYRNPVLGPQDLVIAVSQSGETADTLAAVRHVAGQVGQTIAVVNVPTSTIAREADIVLPIMAGPEIGVASTKAFTAQMLVLLVLASKAGQVRGHLGAAAFGALVSQITSIPQLMAQALLCEADYARVATRLSQSTDILFLGRRMMFPIALEAALKLKETSYIHAEAYAAGELKHGPIALIDKAFPVVLFAPKDAVFDKTLSNMHEVKARDADVVLVSDPEGVALAGDVPFTLTIPKAPDVIAPFVYAIPAQMLAYHTALKRGTDVDQPRNLAKSVTVE
jgi:glucosamine--fructose-6-phosphate aminotransferase (isomerizing)